MSVWICKNFILTNVYYNASIPLASTHEKLRKLEKTNLGAICTKSCTLESNIKNDKVFSLNRNLSQEEDYQEETIWFDYDSETQTSYNRYGLKNQGVDYFLQYARERNKISKKPFILSFYPRNIDDIWILTERNLEGVNSIEINLSCPNSKHIVGKKFNTSHWKLDLSHMFGRIAIGIKLRLCIIEEEILNNIRLIQNLHPDYIVCGNTLPNGISSSGFEGAIGGKILKPIALWNIKQYKKYFKIRGYKNLQIIGCGGIFNTKDIQEYLQCGAKAVQIGTALQTANLNINDKAKL
jgi:dihydroorotate dehydrogenase